MDQVQKMCVGDIPHVKGRVLPQPDHIVFRKVNFGFRAEVDVIAHLAPQRDGISPRDDTTLNEGQLVRRVKEQRVPARLRLQPDAKRAVAVDVDRPDRVHLQGNFQGHGHTPLRCALDGAVGRQMQSVRLQKRFPEFRFGPSRRPVPHQSALASTVPKVRRR